MYIVSNTVCCNALQLRNNSNANCELWSFKTRVYGSKGGRWIRVKVGDHPRDHPVKLYMISRSILTALGCVPLICGNQFRQNLQESI